MHPEAHPRGRQLVGLLLFVPAPGHGPAPRRHNEVSEQASLDFPPRCPLPVNHTHNTQYTIKHTSRSAPPRAPLVTEVSGPRPVGKKRPMPAAWKSKTQSQSQGSSRGDKDGWTLKPGFLLS